MRGDDRNLLLRELEQGLADHDPGRSLECAWRLYHHDLLVQLIAAGLDPSLAEDGVQDAFRIALSQWDSFDGADIKSWLHTLARYVGMGLRRDRGRRSARTVPRADHHDRPTPPLRPELVDVVKQIAAYREGLDSVGRAILDAVLRPGSDAELVQDLARTHEVSLSVAAVRARRKRIRQGLARVLDLERP